MSNWHSTKARLVLSALEKNGWKVKRSSGSHKIMAKLGFRDYVFAFHDKEEIGPQNVSTDY